MANKIHRRGKQKSNPYLPVVAGLFLIGIAILMLTSRNTNGSAASQEQYGAIPITVDFPAPGLTLENLEGELRSLAEYQGQVVLVNNWATWCPPCKAEMPILEAYYEDHAQKGFVIIAIEAGDPKDIVFDFAKDYSLQFQVWLDPQGASTRAFGNGSLPNSYVIDRTGTVRYAWTGEVSRETLESYVTPLINEQ